MLNILASEKLKLKHNKLLLICFSIGLLTLIFSIVTDIYYLNNGGLTKTFYEWYSSSILLFQLIIFPILSGLVITFLINKEYSDNTILNNLTAPTNRVHFILAKIIVWFIWHILLTISFIIILCLGLNILYGSQLLFNNIYDVFILSLKISIFNFLTLIPVTYIAVLQKKKFFYSLIFCFTITGIGFAGLYWPELLGKVIPWSAVSLICVSTNSTLGIIPYLSILFCAIIGLILTIFTFKHQEL